ncbi:CG11475 [Drosophila busckii]|uniref:Sugar phosphate phosphatase n=1 Tax=Drosophila busckii TaxID=30019 RepID=A0A0M5J4P6_DROBS|nr:damage-control phosphatase ARMT1 [Drosophila busckii]ALC41194.1 CG11475 [Drosophila busckii]
MLSPWFGSSRQTTTYNSESEISVVAESSEDSDIELLSESEFVSKHDILDYGLPLHEEVTGRYKRTFAYRSLKTHMPALIKTIIKHLHEHEPRIMQQCGDYAYYDLKRVIRSLKILRREVLLNSKFKLFHDNEPDAQDWNKLLKSLDEHDKDNWYAASWLQADCYLYRRIWAAFRREKTLRDFDYFGQEKTCAARNIVYIFINVLKQTKNLSRDCRNFQLMLKISLWANRCDLNVNKEPPDARIVQLIDDYDEDLIVDHSAELWRLLTEDAHTTKYPCVVDFVLDNAGFELFADLVLAAYLIDTKLAAQVRFHVKAIPWFVSDTTAVDFNWMLRFLYYHEIPVMRAFGRKLCKFQQRRALVLCDTCRFWTSPHGFKDMGKLAPCVYVHMSMSDLIIFKGDLNYRKLLNDINWRPTDPFANCLGGFLPTNICALRAIKSDIYCGMPICVVEWLTEENPEWMCKGEKAVIQLARKPRP